MPFQLELEVDGKRFADAERGLNALAARFSVAFNDLDKIAQREIKKILDSVIAAMKQRHSTAWSANQNLPSGSERGRLARRSGKGIRSLKSVVVGSGDVVTGSISVGFPLSVHERGATIRPRRAKFLAIPLPAALDSRGIPKRRGGPRAYKNTFVARSRRGNLLIFEKKPGGRITPLFVLKSETKIPARLGLGVTLDKAAPIFVDRLFAAALRELQKAV